MGSTYPTSVHGGHSGQFCSHAEGMLEEMVLTYIDHGYPWVGITEHMPPVSDAFLYPEEKAAGLTANDLKKRFADYMVTCRRLQVKYAGDIQIYVGFETEDYTGSREYAKMLMQDFAPDYIVGSLHHVKDLPFDCGRKDYETAVCACGGIEGLYEHYFDQQYEMIQILQPAVVGHMDIIRLYDPDYRARIAKPNIWKRVERNLKRIKELNLILDFNLRPLSRGEDEPYLSSSILHHAGRLGIDIVPGDDSHRVSDIHKYMDRAIELLKKAGLPTDWKRPTDDL